MKIVNKLLLSYMICIDDLFIFVFLGASVFYNAYFGQGFGPIFLDDLLCTGRETRIIDCPRSTSTGVGNVDFCRGHLDDAGLRCVEGTYQT